MACSTYTPAAGTPSAGTSTPTRQILAQQVTHPPPTRQMLVHQQRRSFESFSRQQMAQTSGEVQHVKVMSLLIVDSWHLGYIQH